MYRTRKVLPWIAICLTVLSLAIATGGVIDVGAPLLADGIGSGNTGG